MVEFDTHPEGQPVSPHDQAARRWPALVVGLLLLILGVAFAATYRRACGDTWIGLAAGRLILERGCRAFPVGDEFTWTFTGRTWYNQNWLWHVLTFQLYNRVFPSALLGLKLLCLLSMAGAMVLATYRMCRETLLAVIVAVAALSAGLPLWDIRPATGSHLLASLMLLVLVSTTYGRALWGVLVLPLLLVWSNTHGSFPLGYLLAGVWIAGEMVERFRRPAWRRMSAAGIAVTGGAALLSVPLGAWISPYGWQNLLHPLVVMRSPVFQQIREWRTPFRFDATPGLRAETLAIQMPFFIALGVGVAGLAAGYLIHQWARRRVRPGTPIPSDADLSRCGRGMALSEVAVAALATYLAAKHLRFLPTFYVLTAPIFCKFLALRARECAWVWNVTRGGLPADRRLARTVGIGIGVAMLAMVSLAGRLRFLDAYVDPERRPWRQGLFLHHVDEAREPRRFAAFARANGLRGRLFTQWVWSGYVLFEWREATVFADGRSQALFDEKMYRLHHEIERIRPVPGLSAVAFGRIIDESLQHPDVPTGLNAEMVLLAADGPTAGWFEPLLATGDWIPLLWDLTGMLLIRRNAATPGLPEALARLEHLDLQWPEDIWGLASRGLAAQFLRIPNHEESLRCLRQAVAQKPYHSFFAALRPCYLRLGRAREGLQYFHEQSLRLQAGDCGLTPSQKQAALQIIGQAMQQFDVQP